MRQATQEWDGEVLKRWLVYFENGRKAITWAPNKTDAHSKMRAHGRVRRIAPSASGQRPS